MSARSSWIVPVSVALISSIGGAVASYYGSGAASGSDKATANEHRLSVLEQEVTDLGLAFSEHRQDDKDAARNVWFAIGRKQDRGTAVSERQP